MDIRLDSADLKTLVMESLKRILKENMETEGGNSVPNAEPIRGDLAGKVAQQIMSEIEKGMKCVCRTLGSTGKKGPDQTSGDIDIGIVLPWEKRDRLINFLQSRYGNFDIHLNPSFGVMSIGFPYMSEGARKIVQVDFMFTNNIEFSEFMHWSPDFTKNESRFKGLYRTELVKAMALLMPVDKTKYPDVPFDENDLGGRYTGEIKEFWRYAFNDEIGLVLLHKTRLGKKVMLKRAETIKKDTQVISNNVNEIMNIVMGPEVTKADLNSFETMMDFIFSGRYKYGTPEMIKNVLEHYLTNRKVTGDEAVIKEVISIINERLKENGYDFSF